MYGKVAQWLKFYAVNHDIMGSNPVEISIFIFYLIIFVVDFFCIFSMFFIYL